MNYKLCACGAEPYTDIDCLACAIAYAELYDCIAFLPGKLNATIPQSVRQWHFDFTDKSPNSAEQFVLVDFSNPKVIPQQIPLDAITNVYDHHTGVEAYWGARIYRQLRDYDL